jgi:hypothetical protein
MGKEVVIGSLIAIAGLGGGYFMSMGATEAPASPTGQAVGRHMVDHAGADDGDECGSIFEITTYDVDGMLCGKAFEVTEDDVSLLNTATEYCEDGATDYFIQDAEDGGFRVVASVGRSSIVLDTLYGCDAAADCLLWREAMDELMWHFECQSSAGWSAEWETDEEYVSLVTDCFKTQAENDME